jgi:hypothetical protein
VALGIYFAEIALHSAKKCRLFFACGRVSREEIQNALFLSGTISPARQAVNRTRQAD